jgi:hypothetical protein
VPAMIKTVKSLTGPYDVWAWMAGTQMVSWSPSWLRRHRIMCPWGAGDQPRAMQNS